MRKYLIKKGTIGEYLGKTIIEDNTLTEIRLPTAIIEILKGHDIWLPIPEEETLSDKMKQISIGEQHYTNGFKFSDVKKCFQLIQMDIYEKSLNGKYIGELKQKDVKQIINNRAGKKLI